MEGGAELTSAVHQIDGEAALDTGPVWHKVYSTSHVSQAGPDAWPVTAIVCSLEGGYHRLAIDQIISSIRAVSSHHFNNI